MTRLKLKTPEATPSFTREAVVRLLKHASVLGRDRLVSSLSIRAKIDSSNIQVIVNDLNRVEER